MPKKEEEFPLRELCFDQLANGDFAVSVNACNSYNKSWRLAKLMQKELKQAVPFKCVRGKDFNEAKIVILGGGKKGMLSIEMRVKPKSITIPEAFEQLKKAGFGKGLYPSIT